MEPTSLIIAALVAGAAKAAGDAAPDAYNGLKALIKRKFEGDSLGQGLVDAKPEEIKQAEALLKDRISKANVDKDKEILKAAQEIMKKEDPEGASTGKYDLRGAQGVQIGDFNKQENKF